MSRRRFQKSVQLAGAVAAGLAKWYEGDPRVRVVPRDCRSMGYMVEVNRYREFMIRPRLWGVEFSDGISTQVERSVIEGVDFALRATQAGLDKKYGAHSS